MRALDLTGQQFGRLTAISKAKSRYKKTFWLCTCECGNTVEVALSNIKFSTTVSCGCQRAEKASQRATHGMTGTSEYRTYAHIKGRCNNVTDNAYADYGGRGIKMSKEWEDSFEVFLKDMGFKPSIKHTIDRINNDKGYSKGNCKWATQSEQMRHTRATTLTIEQVVDIKYYLYIGMSNMDVAELMNVPDYQIRNILYRKSWANV